MGHPAPLSPSFIRPELRSRLIAEEGIETLRAIRSRDILGTIDGLCDLLYVTYGAAVEFGIDLEPFWDEVHRTNMAKAGGPTRDDGKVMKPEGWTPPDITGIYRRLYGEKAA